MQIVTSDFFWFGCLTLLIYYLLCLRNQNRWLLVCSYAFIASWSWTFFLAVVASTLINYAIGRRLSAEGKKSTLIAGIAFNILLLLFFKNADFFSEEFSSLLRNLGIRTASAGIRILLPIGLSYYSLQAISFLSSVRRRQMSVPSFTSFALYLAYFPKLLAGPIERPESFIQKLNAPRIVDDEAAIRNLSLIVIGVFRKIVIADSIASVTAWTPFADPGKYSGSTLCLTLIAYFVYLYNDFVGYTNIARGVSGLFGIELSRNFNLPFLARGFSDFWNRWHITLSHWLRDQVYLPFSRSLLRRTAPKHLTGLILPPIVTMMVSALWHASWQNGTIFMWGLLHGAFLSVEQTFRLRRRVSAESTESFLKRSGKSGLVFALNVLALVPFHPAIQWQTMWVYWKRLTVWGEPVLFPGSLCLLFFASIVMDWLIYREQNHVPFAAWPLPARASVLAAAMLGILAFSGVNTTTDFVYQGF